jgi:hypothetical protein
MIVVKPRFSDGEETTIHRLSQREREILALLRWYEDNGKDMMIAPLPEYYGRYFFDDNHDRYMAGRIVTVSRIMKELNIKHRASLSRTLKRMEEKGLVYSMEFSLNGKGDTLSNGVYTKYVTLTGAGEEVAKLLNDPLPADPRSLA